MPPSSLKVRITAEARAAVLAEGANAGYAKTGIVLRRVGPIGDVKRQVSGEAEWKIERPRPLKVELQDLTARTLDPSFTVVAEGIPVVLLLMPLPGEAVIDVSLLAGKIHAEASDA